MQLQWLEGALEINGYRLIQEWGAGITALNPEFPNFALMKTTDNVKAYMDFLLRAHPMPYRRILELGIMKGGSCVLFNELLQPAMHAVVDVNKDCPESLRHYVAAVEREGRSFRLGLGIDQTDSVAIRKLAGPEPLDLIVDDASHDYALSRKSFEGLFPLLRAGGVYALEDWGWAHWGPWQSPDDGWAGKPALSNLVFELTMLCTGSVGSIIAEIQVTPVTAYVVRGAAAMDRLEINASYFARGRKLNLI